MNSAMSPLQQTGKRTCVFTLRYSKQDNVHECSLLISANRSTYMCVHCSFQQKGNVHVCSLFISVNRMPYMLGHCPLQKTGHHTSLFTICSSLLFAVVCQAVLHIGSAAEYRCFHRIPWMELITRARKAPLLRELPRSSLAQRLISPEQKKRTFRTQTESRLVTRRKYSWVSDSHDCSKAALKICNCKLPSHVFGRQKNILE